MLKERLGDLMIEFIGVRSTSSEIAEMQVDQHHVYLRSNIQAVEENVGEENEFIGWQYDEVQYEKDQYIKVIANKNKILESQLTDTQLALVELYEGMLM